MSRDRCRHLVSYFVYMPVGCDDKPAGITPTLVTIRIQLHAASVVSKASYYGSECPHRCRGTDLSIVFAKWRQCDPHLIHCSLGPGRDSPFLSGTSVPEFSQSSRSSRCRSSIRGAWGHFFVLTYNISQISPTCS